MDDCLLNCNNVNTMHVDITRYPTCIMMEHDSRMPFRQAVGLSALHSTSAGTESEIWSAREMYGP